ncbi:MAG: SRPBCC domain-containing protein [Bacteroidia bacterium]|nr:SRPBCC domain-containing protein [Bacteroidia bacterium]
MKHTLITQIHISAPTAKVWQVLTAFEQYPHWNPFLVSLTGKVEPGKRIHVKIQPPDGKPMTFKPKVLAFEKEKEFKWLGNLLFPGIFDGEHYFQLIENADGSTTLIHGENFQGLLVGFLKSMLEGNTRQGFQSMNRALKFQCEQ